MAELHAVRAALNELPFHDGKRQVPLGAISEMFPGADELSLADKLGQIEAELRNHDLVLIRDQDELYAEQRLQRRAVDWVWLSEGLRWSTTITTAALEMVLPGLAGWWLEKQFGIPYLMLAGLALGAPLGLWHLILMTRNRPGKRR